MFRSLLRAPPALLIVPALLAASCSSAPPVPAATGWRPTPSTEIADRCRGDAAQGCYQDALKALAAEPMQALLAQNLLAAACDGDVQAACEALATRFRPPSALRVPSISASPPYGTAVVEFTCRLTADGLLEGCERTRSANTGRGLDEAVEKQMATRQGLANYRPATVDGKPYTTEVRLVYVMYSESIAGPNIAAVNDGRPTRRNPY